VELRNFVPQFGERIVADGLLALLAAAVLVILIAGVAAA
jgi:hypothetical protein